MTDAIGSVNKDRCNYANKSYLVTYSLPYLFADLSKQQINQLTALSVVNTLNNYTNIVGIQWLKDCINTNKVSSNIVQLKESERIKLLSLVNWNWDKFKPVSQRIKWWRK